MSEQELLRFVDQAGFIFRGRVLRQGTADPQLMASAAGKIVTVEIEEILHGTDVMRGLSGKEAAVVTDHGAAMEDGGVLVLFTNCLVLGDQVVVREVGHLRSSREVGLQVLQAVKAQAEEPLRVRVAQADLVATGKVLGSRSAETGSLLKSEHDPDWWIARVVLISVLKGKAEGEIEVLFPHSMDIAWFKVPKLHEGMSGVFILRHLKAKDAPKPLGRAIYQITDPLDFLPDERLVDARRALDLEKGDR